MLTPTPSTSPSRPAELSPSTLWKQELCQEMAKEVNVPITEATMVTTGNKHAVATSGMDDAWFGWMQLPNDQKTWVRWKTMWGGAFLEKRELIRLTGIAYNGMENQAVETEMGNDGRCNRKPCKRRRLEERHH